ncbi:site-specific integrase [[Clostridium] innocuum]|nr:site-specific integrase [[Clostridium] innocuum]
MKTVIFKDLAEEWITLKKLSVKHSSIVKYETILNHHILPFFKDYDVRKINNLSILEFFESKINKELSNSLLHSIKSVFSSILDYGSYNYEMKQISLNNIKIPTIRTVKNVLSFDDRNKIISYVQTKADSLSIGMLLALYGGLRLGEICALEWSHIDFKNQVVYVKGTASRLKCEKQGKKTEVFTLSPKSSSSYREVPIPDFIIDYLKQYKECEEDSHYVLSNSCKIYEPRRLERNFCKFCMEYQIQSNFHNLRHSYATDCVRNNVEIKALSEMLGHSNVSITLGLYVHTSLEEKKKEICKIQSPFKS